MTETRFYVEQNQLFRRDVQRSMAPVFCIRSVYVS